MPSRRTRTAGHGTAARTRPVARPDAIDEKTRNPTEARFRRTRAARRRVGRRSAHGSAASAPARPDTGRRPRVARSPAPRPSLHRTAPGPASAAGTCRSTRSDVPLSATTPGGSTVAHGCGLRATRRMRWPLAFFLP